eukprot:scaffold20937_cov33-Tisochrysis_lutea.AAC.2
MACRMVDPKHIAQGVAKGAVDAIVGLKACSCLRVMSDMRSVCPLGLRWLGGRQCGCEMDVVASVETSRAEQLVASCRAW